MEQSASTSTRRFRLDGPKCHQHTAGEAWILCALRGRIAYPAGNPHR